MLYDSDTLIHFTSQDVFLNHIFSERLLKVGKFRNSHDPFEFRPRNFTIQNNGIDPTITSEHLSSLEIMGDYFLDAKFISFCNNNTRPAATKSRMWDQYANRYRGVGILVSKSRLQEYIQKNFPNVAFMDELSYIEIRYKFLEVVSPTPIK